jgi:CheY-specific phosphatase CheX
MTSQGYLLKKETLREESFTYSKGLTVFINYYGPIQGDYLLSMEEATAARIAGVYREGMGPRELSELHEQCNGLFMEVLNVSVGRSIEQLEKQFSDLTYVAACAAYGEIYFPRSLACSMTIEGAAGKIITVFAINLTTLKIAKKLEETLKLIKQLTKGNEGAVHD